MEYLLLAMYLLGFYLNLHLAENILDLVDEKTERLPLIVGCLFWPVSAAWYLYVRVKASLQTNSK